MYGLLDAVIPAGETGAHGPAEALDTIGQTFFLIGSARRVARQRRVEAGFAHGPLETFVAVAFLLGMALALDRFAHDMGRGQGWARRRCRRSIVSRWRCAGRYRQRPGDGEQGQAGPVLLRCPDG